LEQSEIQTVEEDEVPFTQIMKVNSALERAADRSPWLLEVEGGDQGLIDARFADAIEDRGVLVLEVVDARRVLEGPLPSRRLRVRKDVELERWRKSYRARLIQ